MVVYNACFAALSGFAWFTWFSGFVRIWLRSWVLLVWYLVVFLCVHGVLVFSGFGALCLCLFVFDLLVCIVLGVDLSFCGFGCGLVAA